MDRKQKEKLRFLLKARKRADKVLATRREAVLKKQDHAQRLQANQALMNQYTQELTDLAAESGILALAEQAALRRGGKLTQEVSYYIDYGINSTNLHQALGDEHRGTLKASHLSLRIIWEEAGVLKEAEIRVHKKGLITFHNSFVPVLPYIWRRKPQILQAMLESAVGHPRPAPILSKKHPQSRA